MTISSSNSRSMSAMLREGADEEIMFRRDSQTCWKPSRLSVNVCSSSRTDTHTYFFCANVLITL